MSSDAEFYRNLLKLYLMRVGDEAGTYYLGWRGDFTPSEMEELDALVYEGEQERYPSYGM
jgi:hypothetical protein